MFKIIPTLVSILILNLPYLSASVYDYAEFQEKKEKTINHFMDSSFDEIIRFDKVVLNTNNQILNDESNDILDDIVQKVTNYTKESKEIKLTIIDHSSLNNLNNALKIQNTLEEKGLDKSIMTLEFRTHKDKLYHGISGKNKNLDNRIMITMYVSLAIDMDEDRDGVHKDDDKCPNTQAGLKVSKNGCKIGTIVILLDGKKKNTSITIHTKDSSIKIDKPNQFISIDSKDNKPSLVQDISSKELSDILNTTLDKTTKEQISFTLLFEGNKLLNQDKVKKIFDEISKRNTPYINIIGHTDTIGSMQENEIVGLKRAKVLENLIINSNVKYLKIDTESYSESNLAVETEDNVFEALNRRVEVFIH